LGEQRAFRRRRPGNAPGVYALLVQHGTGRLLDLRECPHRRRARVPGVSRRGSRHRVGARAAGALETDHPRGTPPGWRAQWVRRTEAMGVADATRCLARASAQDLGPDLVELFARLGCDHGRADHRWHPDFGNEPAAIENMHLVPVIDNARGEFGRLEVTADQTRADLLLGNEPYLAQILEAERKRSARGVSSLEHLQRVAVAGAQLAHL